MYLHFSSLIIGNIMFMLIVIVTLTEKVILIGFSFCKFDCNAGYYCYGRKRELLVLKLGGMSYDSDYNYKYKLTVV